MAHVPATEPDDHDPEVVRLVADAIRDSGMKDAFFDDSAGSWEVEEKPWQYENAARAVLDALAAAGRLLPQRPDYLKTWHEGQP